MSGLCLHFGTCGGCEFQDLPESEYRNLKRQMVERALARHGLTDARIEATAAIPPATRRRATLAARKFRGEVSIGFRGARSHEVINMSECRVLAPAILEAVRGLRELMTQLLAEGDEARLAITECSSGIDLACGLESGIGAGAVARLGRWATKHRVNRISVNGETVVQLALCTKEIAGVPVELPADAFLQPTAEGETLLQDFVRSAFKDARRVADLFAGCGTFALALASSARVHAVDSNESALAALVSAARKKARLKPVTVEVRDLAKRPLQARELDDYDAVVLDPPRAGAPAQAKQLAASRVPSIAYVSCNPDSFGRDARVLVNAGYRLGSVAPIDQFLWSSHIELAASFSRR